MKGLEARDTGGQNTSCPRYGDGTAEDNGSPQRRVTPLSKQSLSQLVPGLLSGRTSGGQVEQRRLQTDSSGDPNKLKDGIRIETVNSSYK